MNLISVELASQRIRDMLQSAAREGLARQAQITKPGRNRHLTGAAVREWFDRSQLSPVNNYVTR
jgi:hypothetical protein